MNIFKQFCVTRFHYSRRYVLCFTAQKLSGIDVSKAKEPSSANFAVDDSCIAFEKSIPEQFLTSESYIFLDNMINCTFFQDTSLAASQLFL